MCAGDRAPGLEEVALAALMERAAFEPSVQPRVKAGAFEWQEIESGLYMRSRGVRVEMSIHSGIKNQARRRWCRSRSDLAEQGGSTCRFCRLRNLRRWRLLVDALPADLDQPRRLADVDVARADVLYGSSTYSIHDALADGMSDRRHERLATASVPVHVPTP